MAFSTIDNFNNNKYNFFLDLLLDGALEMANIGNHRICRQTMDYHCRL